jgi:hypothetical protein
MPLAATITLLLALVLIISGVAVLFSKDTAGWWPLLIGCVIVGALRWPWRRGAAGETERQRIKLQEASGESNNNNIPKRQGKSHRGDIDIIESRMMEFGQGPGVQVNGFRTIDL